MAASLQELTAAWVAVATVTLSEYRRQCWHLAGLACSEVVERADGAVTLWEIAVARCTTATHIGVSLSLFDKTVKDGRMPGPKLTNRPMLRRA